MAVASSISNLRWTDKIIKISGSKNYHFSEVVFYLIIIIILIIVKTIIIMLRGAISDNVEPGSKLIY